ncbi:SdpI family protein [Oscillospiraceae bacterium LTW-04]|nr:SdpI family protein [Oscillospiraceae bacterium MB24-C1]
MKMKKPVIFLVGVLALLPLALTAWFYPRLPATIPMHWNIDGTVRYDPKYNLWIVSALSPLLAVLFPVMAKIDPRRRNYQKFSAAYQGFMIVILLFFLMMNSIVISEALNPGRISVSTVVTIGVGLLFVFLGNIMPKIKSNFYMGARTPWTLSDPDVWFKTNRLSGYLFFISGIIICVCPFILTEKMTFIVLMAITVIVAVIPAVMSYLWYRKNHRNG